MTNPLTILSLSYTRELWDTTKDADRSRLIGYAEEVGVYTAVVFSRKTHGLVPIFLRENFLAIPTNGWTAIDNWFRALMLAAAELRRREYALIQCQDPSYSGLIGYLLGKFFGLPFNICVYGPNPFDQHFACVSIFNRIYSAIAIFVIKRANGIQVDGRATQNSLIKSGIASEKIARKALLATDIGNFCNFKSEVRAEDAPVRLIFVGRLAAQKNLSKTIQVVSNIISKTKRRVIFEIIGDGPERQKLRDLVSNCKLEGEILFSGSLTRSEIMTAYSRSDVFVLGSLFEGFPRVLLEAALMGLPVVSFQVSGSDELVVDGVTGYTLPIGDWLHFENCIYKLISDYNLRVEMGKAALKHAEKVLLEVAYLPTQVQIWRDITSRAL